MSLLKKLLSRNSPRQARTTQGNDFNSGTSLTTPWASVAAVTAHHFAAGDNILFQAGATFHGRLLLNSASTGTPGSPITITSYGTGRATISGDTTEGIYIFNTAGVVIDNINVLGGGFSTNTKNGIMVYTNLSGNVALKGITIKNVDVSGFGDCGVQLGGGNGTSGFDSVTLSNVVSHGNQTAGISSFAPTGQHYAFTNVSIADCVVRDNLGDPVTTSPTGSGIVLRSMNGATVQFCEAYNNGGNNPSMSNGGVGIWTTESTNVLFQFNESHHNHTQGVDGDGFDFDGGTTNSLMQYNYTHDNDGAGFLLCTFTGSSAHSGNIVRYNVSQNDARTTGYGAFQIYQNPINDEIYNNTVYMSSATRQTAGVRFASFVGSNLHFRNNLFVVTGGALLLDVSGGSGTLFQGNDYWASGGAFAIKNNNSVYSSLSAWQTTSQEMLSGARVGMQVDPLLVGAGAGASVDDPHQLSSLAAYKLQPGSALITAGLPLMIDFGLSTGTRDFFGNSIPRGGLWSIGADGGVSAATAPVILSQSGDITLASGNRLDLTVSASGSNDTYQWRKGGMIIPGASLATYTLATVSVSDAGTYDVVVTNSSGSVTSTGVVVMVQPVNAPLPPPPTVGSDSRMVNISTRSLVGTGGDVQIAGFIIRGASPKTVLIRASGPALAQFSVPGLLDDPVLTLYSGQQQLYQNDDWSSDSTTAAAIEATSVAMNLFPLARGGKDAALLVTLQPGGYTAIVNGKNGSTGVDLIEVYEADPGSLDSRLTNLSTRSLVGTGGNLQIAGFIIRGTQSKTVLIRASGPALAQFAVTGLLDDPVLTLYTGQTQLDQNDDWSSDSASAAGIDTVSTAMQLFTCARGGKDAALLKTLPPGSYTAQVTGKNGSTGVALIEVYEVP